jgi:mono/diheme cytochrome c family protein
MPGHAFLKDGDFADVLTYIRSHFSNEASPVTAEEIAAFRKKIAQRP